LRATRRKSGRLQADRLEPPQEVVRPRPTSRRVRETRCRVGKVGGGRGLACSGGCLCTRGCSPGATGGAPAGRGGRGRPGGGAGAEGKGGYGFLGRDSPSHPRQGARDEKDVSHGATSVLRRVGGPTTSYRKDR